MSTTPQYPELEPSKSKTLQKWLEEEQLTNAHLVSVWTNTVLDFTETNKEYRMITLIVTPQEK